MLAWRDDYPLYGKKLDHDFCTFMGMWMGNGSCNYQYRDKAIAGVTILTNEDLYINEYSYINKWLANFASRYSRRNFPSRYCKDSKVISPRENGDIRLCSSMLGTEIMEIFGKVDLGEAAR